LLERGREEKDKRGLELYAMSSPKGMEEGIER
jgi:hypothetical protein